MDEKDRTVEKEDHFAEVIEAGAEAMMAGMRGDNEEWKKQVKRGRKAYQKYKGQQIDRLIDQMDATVEADRRKRRKQKPKKEKKLTMSLGDLLKDAGVVK